MPRCKWDGPKAKTAQGPEAVIKFSPAWLSEGSSLSYNSIGQIHFKKLRQTFLQLVMGNWNNTDAEHNPDCIFFRCIFLCTHLPRVWIQGPHRSQPSHWLVYPCRPTTNDRTVSYWWWIHRWAALIGPPCTRQRWPLSTPSETTNHWGRKSSHLPPPPAQHAQTHV